MRTGPDLRGRHLHLAGCPQGAATDRAVRPDQSEGSETPWAALDLVDADFTHTCGDGTPARGHVRTWGGAGAGMLPCSVEPTDEAAGRIAAQRLCPTGSEAVEPL
ncbi:hypothetical protein ACFV28_14570 [Streptomyces sp. NPDC059720]|uniref:hypothetical protein n=1 Tax=Streptomyces sp. NPDC059720 TaxID=3346924 RepID=UPI00368FDEAD